MVDFKLDFIALKRRIVGWLRDLILVFTMWSIWLVRDYLPDLEIKNIVKKIHMKSHQSRRRKGFLQKHEVI